MESSAQDKAVQSKKRRDMSWREHLVMLLSFGAAAEHCLMVEYLYAAYSLRPDEPDPEKREMIEGWRAQILAVAREEMGHLLTVQNVLCLLGAPMALGREDSLWAHKYYPYDFSLTPFSLKTVAYFVYAEMEAKDVDEFDADQRPLLRKVLESVKEAGARGENAHHVGALYAEIVDVISDPERIPDSDFDELTFERQFSWDEWGRNYRPAPYELDAAGNRVLPDTTNAKTKTEGKTKTDAKTRKHGAAHLEIPRVASRTDAVRALVQLAAQGEVPHIERAVAPTLWSKSKRRGEPSHFDRFFAIYKEFSEELEKDENWSPAAGVCTDPTTRKEFAQETRGAPRPLTPIKAIAARRLAQIFNQRYRLLLNYLAHAFRIGRTARLDRPNLRAMLMHRAFGEMYNLKTLAGMLVRLPRLDDCDSPAVKDPWAGPPFELPYSTELPDADGDVWRMHKDVLETSRATCRDLISAAHAEAPELWEKSKQVKAQLDGVGAEVYLRTLMELDEQALQWIDAILGSQRNGGGGQ